MKKIISFVSLFACYFILNLHKVNASNNQQIITVCKVKKTTYARINTSFSLDSAFQTYITHSDEETGETYTLTRFAKVKDETEKLNLFNLRYYNITYKGKIGEWNLLEMLNDGAEITFLNEGNPLIIRTLYSNNSENTFFFNIDNLGHGNMSMVSTRWRSPMNSFNHQALYYAECSPS